MKTLTEHTPGPWKYDETWALVHGADNSEVCAIHSGSPGEQRNNRNVVYANAHLIAAAPELLAALKEALPQVERTHCRAPDGETCDNMVIAIVRAAIARAEGGAK